MNEAELAAYAVSDFHTHILPSLDDGSQSREETLAMLDMAAGQRVKHLVATPHFYPRQDSMEGFLQRRRAAAQALREIYISTKHPRIYLGAEVGFYNRISCSERLRELCIEGTDFLLLEMPFCRWTDDVLEELFAIQEDLNLQPVLAHIERYLSFQKKKTLPYLVENGIWIQSNAAFFTDDKTKKKAMRMLKKRQIHLLGSDCHHAAHRPPNLLAALREIAADGGREDLQWLGKNAGFALAGAKPLSQILEETGQRSRRNDTDE